MAPKVSFCLFCHNQAPYVGEALAGAFGQDYADLEIIVTDDGSTDRTLEIIRDQAARYQGPHRVLVRHHAVAGGLAEAINQVMAVASGEFIVVAAGDDVSHPGRCQALVQAWLAGGRRFHLFHSGFRRIDPAGQNLELSADERRLQNQAGPVVQQPTPEAVIRHFVPHIYGCTAAWDRTLFDRFGPLKSRVVQEDVVMALRGTFTGGVLFLPAQLVDYRLHSQNIYHIDIRLIATGEVLSRDEFSQLEAFKARNLGFKAAIHDNFEADVASAQQAGLLEAARAATLVALVRQQRARTKAEITLRTAGLGARAAALAALWQLERHLSFSEIMRVLPRPLYERIRIAFHSFHRNP